ncbi:hypothetical protein SXCC_01381 [Gluconacetobacter sp. SXCC-1]|nr:hypothetical protein SXCC_01381 [Gluconacetobacter sp. SXCC-1]
MIWIKAADRPPMISYPPFHIAHDLMRATGGWGGKSLPISCNNIQLIPSGIQRHAVAC